MADYCVLVLPSANRVYADTGPTMAGRELAALNEWALGGGLHAIGPVELGGVPYIGFATAAGTDLDGAARAAVANLSARYAVFAREGELLRPVEVNGLDRWPEDLVTIPRYVGKTNEQLTKLMVNLALAAAEGAAGLAGERWRLLDPLCGRGTTLNQGFRYGLDVAGVDVDGRDTEAWATFFTTWLEDKKVKHRVERRRVRREGRIRGSRVEVRVQPRQPEEQQAVMVTGASSEVVNHFGTAAFDAIVTDLPYGVQHGSRAGERLQRSPEDLLSAVLPAWHQVLRPRAALVFAWNLRTLSRPAALAAVGAAGFEVIAGDGRFEHRVDRAITRDVLVARRR